VDGPQGDVGSTTGRSSPPGRGLTQGLNSGERVPHPGRRGGNALSVSMPISRSSHMGYPPDRDWRFPVYVAARTVSRLGDNLWAVLVGFSAGRLHDPALLGVMFAMQGAPVLALGVFAGAIVDRFGARPVMLACDACALAITMSAAIAAWGRQPPAALLLAVSLLFGIVQSFYQPCLGSYVPQLIPQEQYVRGNSLNQAADGVASVLGNAAAGLVFAAGGFALGAAIDSGSFLAIWCVLAAIRPRYAVQRAAQERSPLSDVARGLTFVWASRPLLGLVVLAAALNLFLLPMGQVGVIQRVISGHWGSTSYGFIEAAFAIGMITGSGLTAWLRTPSAGRVVCAGAVTASLAFFAVALGPTAPAVAAAVFVVGAALAAANSHLMAIVQTLTPPHLHGRVITVLIVFSTGAIPLGDLAIGAATARWGAEPAMVVGSLCMLSLAVSITAFGRLSDVRTDASESDERRPPTIGSEQG
jgi:hypothetical protein